MIQANQNRDVVRRGEPQQIQPFSKEILATSVPHDFKVPIIKAYDGIGDPYEHLAAFDLQMIISGGNDAIKCKMFGGTQRERP